MTIFNHSIWKDLKPYAVLSSGRNNLDLLQLPDDLRARALAITLPCCACGEPIHIFRARMKSSRSRIAGQVEERRLFYAATCPSSANAGCARSVAARNHKRSLKDILGVQREVPRSITVQILDEVGSVIAIIRSEVKEPFKIDLPPGATSISLVPA
jgi:hypothetical protein